MSNREHEPIYPSIEDTSKLIDLSLSPTTMHEVNFSEEVHNLDDIDEEKPFEKEVIEEKKHEDFIFESKSSVATAKESIEKGMLQVKEKLDPIAAQTKEKVIQSANAAKEFLEPIASTTKLSLEQGWEATKTGFWTIEGKMVDTFKTWTTPKKEELQLPKSPGASAQETNGVMSSTVNYVKNTTTNVFGNISQMFARGNDDDNK
jgi:hypothetical protein